MIVGPILAIFMGHVFGAALGTRVALGRPLTRHERQAVFVEECRFLVVAVPPLAILVGLTIAGVSYTRIIQVIVFTGVLSLGVWGGAAGRADRLGAGALDRLRPGSRGHHLGAPGVASARSRALPSVRAVGFGAKGAAAFRLRVDDRYRGGAARGWF